MIQSRTLSKLINALEHPDVSMRRRAAESLSEADERAIYPLLKALRDDNPGVQDAAMRSLIAIGGEVVAYMVIPLLREDSYLRNTALLILKQIGVASIPLLYPLLKDKDDNVRKFSLDLLGEIKDGISPEKIVPLLHDPNPNVRASAAKAIGALMYKEAVPHLIDALRDEEWVCFSVLEALGELKDERSVGPITELLLSESDTLRHAAIEALGRIGSPLSAKPLRKFISKAKGIEKVVAVKSLVQVGVSPDMTEAADILVEILKDGDWEDRLIALRGISTIRYDKAVPLIVDLAGSLDTSIPEEEERFSAFMDALMELRCEDSLIELINSPDIKYRGKVIVIQALGDLRSKKAVPHLIEMLKSPIRDIRRASSDAIGKIGDEAAMPSLIPMLEDREMAVVLSAIEALARIGGKEALAAIESLRGHEDVTIREKVAHAISIFRSV